MVGLIILSVLYLVWSFYAARNIYKEYKKSDRLFDLGPNDVAWLTFNLVVLILVCCLNAIEFLENINK